MFAALRRGARQRPPMATAVAALANGECTAPALIVVGLLTPDRVGLHVNITEGA
eukprot:gene49864-47589_t